MKRGALAVLSSTAISALVLAACIAGSTHVELFDPADGQTSSDADITPPPDVRDGEPPAPTEDASPTIDASADAPVVDVQYNGCETFAACGGNLTGTWQYQAGGCVTAFDAKKCPTLDVRAATVQGALSFDGKTVTGRTVFSGTVDVPPACLPTAANGDCAAVAAIEIMASPTGLGVDTATCTNDGHDGCLCDVTRTTVDPPGTAYTVNGDGFSIGGTSYEFCVSGAELRLHRTTGGDQDYDSRYLLAK